MSEGRGSSYRVVSAEELRRRALAAAYDHLRRAEDSLAEFEAEARALAAIYGEAIYGGLGSEPWARPHGKDGDPESIETAAAQIEIGVAVKRTAVLAAAEQERLDRLVRSTGSVLSLLRPADTPAGLGVPVTATQPIAAQPVAAAALKTALRVVARLPIDCPGESAGRCDRLITEIRSAARPRAEVLLTALRDEVQSALRHAETISLNRQKVQELLARIDGLEGSSAALMRGHLRGLSLESRFPASLEAEVDQVRTSAVRIADRKFALSVTKAALEEQGYKLGPDFVTAVESAEGELAPLPGSGAHAVRIRERAGQILLNVVRFAGESAHAVDDIGATKRFCDSFDRVVERSRAAGLDLTELVNFEPGSGHLEIRPGRNPFSYDSDGTETEQERRSR